jgi:hypothetical protein
MYGGALYHEGRPTMKSTPESLTRLLVTLCLLVFVHLGAACGDDKSLCQQSGEAVCAEACACGGANGCVLVQVGGSIAFDNEADCRAVMITAGCAGDDGSMDVQFQACLDGIDTGICADTGGGVQGYIAPASCYN